MCRRLECFAAFFVVIALMGFPFEKEALSESGGEKQGIERGRYLSKIGGCNDCHTPGYLFSEGKVPEKLWLTGDRFGWRGPWETGCGVKIGRSTGWRRGGLHFWR